VAQDKREPAAERRRRASRPCRGRYRGYWAGPWHEHACPAALHHRNLVNRLDMAGCVSDHSIT